jgi:NAD(P)H-flavin reductase
MLQIQKIQRETDDITSIFIEGEELAAFSSRKPGQYALIQVQQNGEWCKPHPFTIVNAPADNLLQMTIKSVGAFTSAIPKLQPGTPARLKGPLGSFCKDIDRKSNIIMVAGGIGITPFLSVLRYFSILPDNKNVTLFWANNMLKDVFAQGELSRICETTGLKVVHVILNGEYPATYIPDNAAAYRFESGFLTKEILQAHADLTGASVYLCGSPKMQEFALTQLTLCGVDPATVEKEKFLPQSWNG